VVGGLAATLHGSPVVTYDVHVATEQTADNLARARDPALRKVSDGLLAARTRQPRARITDDTDRDFILTADAALAYGLVDEVLTSRRAQEEARLAIASAA